MSVQIKVIEIQKIGLKKRREHRLNIRRSGLISTANTSEAYLKAFPEMPVFFGVNPQGNQALSFCPPLGDRIFGK